MYLRYSIIKIYEVISGNRPFAVHRDFNIYYLPLIQKPINLSAHTSTPLPLSRPPLRWPFPEVTSVFSDSTLAFLLESPKPYP